MSRFTVSALAVAVTVLTAMVAVSGAVAKNGDPRVKGTCTTAATSTLKLGAEDGAIEVEFEVDQNRNGVAWRVTFRRNGSLVAATTATTRAPSGSFSVRRVLKDTPGSADHIVAVATSSSGAVCKAAGSF